MFINILIVALISFSVTESATIRIENLEPIRSTNSKNFKYSIWNYNNENVSLYAREAGITSMKSRFFIDENFDETNVSLYAIFDGRNSADAAQYASKNLMPCLRNEISTSKLKNKPIDYTKLLKTEILEAENRLSNVRDINGTSVLIVVVDGKMVHTASVGKSSPVTYDDNKIVCLIPMCNNIPLTSTNHENHENGDNLLGYFIDTQKKLAEKDIKVSSYDITHSKFIILASGTLWDKISIEGAVKMVREKNVKTKELVEEAYKLGSEKDITAMIINTSD